MVCKAPHQNVDVHTGADKITIRRGLDRSVARDCNALLRVVSSCDQLVVSERFLTLRFGQFSDHHALVVVFVYP